MGLVFVDSFDHYPTAYLPYKWHVASAAGLSVAVPSSGARTAPPPGLSGYGCLNVVGVTSAVCTYILPDDNPPSIQGTTSATVGFAIMLGDVSDQEFAWISGPDASYNPTKVATIGISDGALCIKHGTFICASGRSVLKTGVWMYLELHCSYSSSGNITLYLDGQQEAIYQANIATVPGASGAVSALDRVAIGYSGVVQLGAPGHYFDDFYASCGSGDARLGPINVVCLTPNGEGAWLQWSPNGSGNHYAVLSDIPSNPAVAVDSDVNYVGAATTSKSDAVQLSNLPATLGASPTIYGVQPCLAARRLGPVGQAGLNGFLYLGSGSPLPTGSPYNGYGIYPLDVYTITTKMFTKVPNGGNTSWDSSLVNSLQVGLSTISTVS